MILTINLTESVTCKSQYLLFYCKITPSMRLQYVCVKAQSAETSVAVHVGESE